jgi:hypothetical protein
LKTYETNFNTLKKGYDNTKTEQQKIVVGGKFRFPVSENKTEAATNCDWRMTAMTATELQGKVNSELRLVSEWNKSGGVDASSAPQTPHLDRVARLCKEADIDLAAYR